MQGCSQTQGQSVMGHGESVKDYVFDLINQLEGGEPIYEWRLPDWLESYREEILTSLYPKDVISEYAIYHDCGKPYCHVVDGDGRSHFPNHALVSKSVYLEIGKDLTVANLIGWDMAFHTCKADEIDWLCKNRWCQSDAITLLITALSEVHSNSRMFGGIESSSFKSKWKTIKRRGNQVCKHYFGEK